MKIPACTPVRVEAKLSVVLGEKGLAEKVVKMI
jgi:hypothetical protein